VVNLLRQKKSIDDEVKAALRTALDEFKQRFGSATTA